MLVIYTPRVTHRVRYVLDHIFGTHFGLDFRVTENPADLPAEGHVLAYSDEPHPGAFNIPRCDLLLSDRIESVEPAVSRETGDVPVLFRQGEGFDLSFDLFAAVFYLLSRYEEYLPHDPDQHGRFRSVQSVLAHPSFDFRPVVDEWLHELGLQLRARNPSLPLREIKPETEHTFDIDQAYAYLGRNTLNKARLLLRPKSWKVLAGLAPDPYDSHAEIRHFLARTGQNARFFFLLQDQGQNPSMVDPNSMLLAKTIQQTADSHPVGLHPSYDAVSRGLFSSEKELLEKHTGKAINLSRQHFLRFTIPSYYPALAAQGIEHDHSMGYSDCSGFRAGYSRSFRYFDLVKDRATALTIHPFCFMDATYIYYKKPDPDEIFTIISKIKRQVSKVNGKLVTVSHNDLLSNDCPVDFWEVLKNCAV